MGCDIHAVLQEFNAQHNIWVTLIKDVFPNRDYALFSFLSGVRGCGGPYDDIATPGLPTDFQVDAQMHHDGFFIGEHSFGHILVSDFCDASTPDLSDEKKFEVETYRTGYTVTWLDGNEDDEYYWIRQYQAALRAFFPNDSERFRLVFGYDS